MFYIIARKFFQTDEWVIRKGFGFGMASESMNGKRNEETPNIHGDFLILDGQI